MSVPLFAIGPRRLRSNRWCRRCGPESDGVDGAITTFLGLVRNHNQGRRVQYLEYEAYEPLALKAFARIDEEVRRRWPGMRLALHHRTGRLEIGEASVAIVTASPHRGDAFAACRYVIERVKQIVPVWKREHFDGGDVWIEGATADSEDAAARERSRADRMRVTVRLFARLRDIAGAAEMRKDIPDVPPGRRSARCGRSRRRVSRDWPPTSGRCRARSTRTTRAWTLRCTTGDEVAFLPRCRGVNRDGRGF